jgi:hypothetical protein
VSGPRFDCLFILVYSMLVTQPTNPIEPLRVLLDLFATDLVRVSSDSVGDWSITSTGKAPVYSIAVDHRRLGLCPVPLGVVSIDSLLTPGAHTHCEDSNELSIPNFDLSHHHVFSIDRFALCSIVLDLSLCNGSTEIVVSPQTVLFRAISESGNIGVEMQHGINQKSFCISHGSKETYVNRYITRDIRQLYNMSAMCTENVLVYTQPALPVVFEFFMSSVGSFRVLIPPHKDPIGVQTPDWVAVVGCNSDRTNTRL